MKIIEHRTFKKSYKKVDLSIQNKLKERIIEFSQNPFKKSLRNHALHGSREGCRSINITGDYRLIFKELSDGRYELVELVKVGTHSQLYG